MQEAKERKRPDTTELADLSKSNIYNKTNHTQKSREINPSYLIFEGIGTKVLHNYLYGHSEINPDVSPEDGEPVR